METTLSFSVVNASLKPNEFTTRATRLAAAGAVGASVVHELRNALAVVSSSLFLARRDRHDEALLLRHLEKASHEVHRAQAVVAAVLGLARGETLAREATLVSSLVVRARSAIVLPTNVTFSVAISPPELLVTGDPVLLERVLSNLYSNAIEALADRGRGAITTRAYKKDHTVCLVVEDDGPGLDPTLGASIFDPLITTKETGTGIGLALVRAVAEAHRGHVQACSRAGGGAVFLVTIPDIP